MIVGSNKWLKPGDAVVIATDWQGRACKQPAMVLRRASRREYKTQDWPLGVLPRSNAMAFYLVSTD